MTIKGIVNRQAVWLTLIGLPIGLIAGFFAGWVLLPAVTEIINLEYSMVGTSVSTSPLIFVIAALFTILTVFISTRKPAKKAAKISPLEAIRYTEQNAYKKRTAKRTNGVKLSRMALSNLGRNRRRSAFIIISLLLCIVLFNSIIIVTQSLDEEKWVNRVTRTDFNVYNSAAFNVIATAISQLLSTLVYLTYILRKRSAFSFSLKAFSPNGQMMAEILKIGVPTLVFQLLTSLSIALINRAASDYGDSVIAGMGAVTRITSMGTLVVFGFLKGFQPIAGFSYGAKKFDRLREAIKTSIIWSTSFCLVVGLVMAAFSTQIILY